MAGYDYPYSNNANTHNYSHLDSDSDTNEDELYNVAVAVAVAAGLGLGDSSYSPSGSGSGSEGSTAHPQHRYHYQPQYQQAHEHESIVSATDGHFGRAEAQNWTSATTAYARDLAPPFHAHRQVPTSSQVPHVPNVWVSDPSLPVEQGSNDKAREAQEDRRLHQQQHQTGRLALDRQHLDPSSNLGGTIALSSPTTAGLGNRTSFTFDPQHSTTAREYTAASPAPSSGPAAYRYTPSHTASSSSSSSAGPPRRAYTETSPLLRDAPPAYTPSPTSPTSNASSTTFNNYQTLSPAARGSSTINMGRAYDSESHGLLAGQNYQAIPQSMGGELDPNDDGHFEYPRPMGWKDRVQQFDYRSRWKLMLLATVLAFFTVGFLSSSSKADKHEETIKFPGTPVGSHPGFIPGKKPPVVDADGTKLAYPPYDEDHFANYDTRICGTKQLLFNPQVFKLDFSPSRNVSLFQDVKNENTGPGKDIHVDGNVIIRRAGSGTPGPSIVLETASNSAAISYTVDWNDPEQRLYLLTPRTVAWAEPNVSPCLSILATIWVPPNSELASLNINNVHLGITLLDNLSLKLNEFARLASTIGPIVGATDGVKDKTQLMHEAPPASFSLDTRYIEVKTMSAAISGAWPLYDYLGLESISGTVTAGVNPQPALKDKPLPAVLYVKTTSGTIEIYEPIADAAALQTAQESAGSSSQALGTTTAESVLPPRQYAVDISTMSGSVKGNVAFGFSCKVHTTSGHVDLTLIPVMDRAQAELSSGETRPGTAILDTHTTSGTTTINVLEPLWADLARAAYVNALVLPTIITAPIAARDPYDIITGGQLLDNAAPAVLARRPLRSLNGRHTATSATLHITYPGSWEGWIDEDSMTGKLSVAGKDVQIVKQENEFPGIKKHILAHKGAEQGQGGGLKAHTTSGSISVVIGSS